MIEFSTWRIFLLLMGSIFGCNGVVFATHEKDKHMFEDPCSLYSITHTPKNFLKYSEALRKELAASFDRNLKYSDLMKSGLIKNIIELYEKKCPILLLDECVHEGFGFCRLSRFWEPTYRQMFEDVVSSSLVQAAYKNNKPIVYTSFGAGGAFTELAILTKLLQQKPDAEITVHLIDLTYETYTYCSNFMQNNTQVSRLLLDITPSISQMVEDIGKKINARFTNEEIKDILYLDILSTHSKYSQIVKWVEKNFPQAKISLFLHKTSNQYLEYLKTHNTSYPDVLSAVDVDDERSSIRNAVGDYLTLLNEVFKVNDQATGFLLVKGRFYSSTIFSIFPSPVEGVQEGSFETDKDELVKYYYKTQLIILKQFTDKE